MQQLTPGDLLTSAATLVGAVLAVVGAYFVGRLHARQAAVLAHNDALDVWRRQSTADRMDHEARIFRNALVALLDECRAWQTNDPNKGLTVAARLLQSELAYEPVREVLAEVTLDPELVRYFLWLQSYAALTADQFKESVRLSDRQIGGAAPNIDQWREVVERLQVMACLLIAAARMRGLAQIASAFEGSPLLRPGIFPPDYRQHVQIDNEGRASAPPWPSNPAYAECSPRARDHAPPIQIHGHEGPDENQAP